jgi:hypothetical protein
LDHKSEGKRQSKSLSLERDFANKLIIRKIRIEEEENEREMERKGEEEEEESEREIERE